MPNYHVKYVTVTVGGTDSLIRCLLDLKQYADLPGEEKLSYISPLFDLIWPSRRILAHRGADSFVENGDQIKRRFLTFTRSLELEQS